MRKIWTTLLIGIAFMSLAVKTGAQNSIRIGEWRMHLPYRTGIAVTQSDTRVFYATEKALVSVRKEDTSDVRFYSKLDGLNDIGITLLKFHRRLNVLVAVYGSSNIDLIYQDGIFNASNIADNNTIVGSKKINNIWVNDGDIMYLSCDFGLVEFNLATGKFGFTMYTETPVRGFTRHDGADYIATDRGLYRFDAFGTELQSNFKAWDFLGPETGLPSSYEAQDVASYDNILFASVDNALHALEDDEFVLWDVEAGKVINFISPEGQHLKVGYVCANQSCAGLINFYNSEGPLGQHGYQCVGQPTYAIEDEQGRVWYADQYEGIRYASNYRWGCTQLQFNTPYSSNVSEIALKDNTVFVASGGVTDRFASLRRPDGFFTLDKGEWSFLNRTNNDQLAEADPLDYYRILPHPNPDSPIVYVGSYYSGLLVYNTQDSVFRFYDQDNSALQGAVGDPLRERVAGLAMDDEGNLWMTCSSAPRPIVVYKADGSWLNFSTPSSTQLGEIAIDRRGYKWMVSTSSTEGVVVFDDGGTIDNPADDRYRAFRTTNSNLPTNTVTNLAVDKLGDVWVGTDNGPVIFDGAADPFSGNNQGYRVIVDQDGILAYLLGEEEVTTIAIDGGNRKWIGTNNGVFVQSPSGEDQIATYNVNNSPLLSNRIIDIAINPYDGEVFIGTDAGIVSTRGEAIEGSQRHSSNAYAYPNPVPPEYDGPIAIRGLAEDAAVKITNVSGVVVYETRSLGGQAVWDGKDLKGRPADSGVYLVFSTTESQFEKPDALVTKILLVN